MEDKKLLTIALLELAKVNMAEIKRIEARLAEILEVEPEMEGYYWHVSDAIFEGYSQTELFDKLKIKE